MAKKSETERILDRVAGKRFIQAGSVALSTFEALKSGDPRQAELNIKRRVASEMRNTKMMGVASARDHRLDGAEAIKQGRNNLLPISFLSLGLRVSRAVARIQVPMTEQTGTGFLCGPGLFITNHHVLLSARSAQTAHIEFDVTSEDGVRPSLFRLDPGRCFVFSPVEELDFAIVAVGGAIDSVHPISRFGYSPLSAADHKHAIGDFANIIQHPNGEEKHLVIQDNLIAARTSQDGTEQSVLHYFADTEPGSSGSPVFNNEWDVIALHHWGRAMRGIPANAGFKPESVNQGIRISRIVDDLQDRLSTFDPATRSLIGRLLEVGRTQTSFRTAAKLAQFEPSPVQPVASNQPRPVQLDSRNRMAAVTIPVELSLSFKGQPESHDATNELYQDGGERSLPKTGSGYRTDFLDHHSVELPTLRGRRKETISPLLKPERYPTAQPGELQFTHFSVVMNKERRLPWFGACNVDGSLLFGINSDRELYQYEDQNVSIFAAQDAEGGYGWKRDRRIPKEHQTLDDWYTGTNELVPRANTDDASRFVRIADFDRGHIVRRTEPIWGEPFDGRAANYQTFNVVNAAPQDPVFNQSQVRDPATISSGEEERSWFGMEVAILRIATNEDRKFNIFTGPVFEDDDPFFASGKDGQLHCQVPMAFWKVAVWEEGDQLRSIAMIASQDWALRKSETGGESFTGAGELFRLRDFLTKVSTLERRTGVSFGRAVRDADVLGALDGRKLRSMTLDDFRDHIGDNTA